MTHYKDAEFIRAIIAWGEAYTGEEICTFSLAAHLDNQFPRITAEQLARCEDLCDEGGPDEISNPAERRRLWADCLASVRGIRPDRH